MYAVHPRTLAHLIPLLLPESLLLSLMPSRTLLAVWTG